MLISEPMVLFHMLLMGLLPQLLPTLLPNVKLKLMPIQLTSTMDTIPDMPDTAMLDGVDMHTLMLEYMAPMPATTDWLLLHLTQLTPISSTPPDSDSALTTLAKKFHANLFSNLPKILKNLVLIYFFLS